MTFYKKWEGDPRNFLSYHNWDAPSIRAALSSGTHSKNNTQEKDFPYLRGPKISSLWLRMLRDNVKLEKLQNMQSVPIPVDVHTARATFCLGVIQGEAEESFVKTSEKIREAWFESVENLEVNDRPLIPLDVDQPLWHLSKYGCSKRNPDTGECPIANTCPFSKYCVEGKIGVSNNKIQLNTL